MCISCGCGITPGNEYLARQHTHEIHTTITVLQDLLAENDRQAAHNREHFDRHNMLAINLMSSPGAGKTALLEATIAALKADYRIGVIVGDLETENDAIRIRAQGVPALQITTGQTCHLDAHLVHKALHEFPLANLDLLFIENVGNLVCPASFDLGQHSNVVLLAVTEGHDKPAKYPVMFRVADLVLLTKTDFLPFLEDFKPESAEVALRQLASQAPLYSLSAKTGVGMESWFNWLRDEINKKRAQLSQYRPHHASLMRL
jgi:hydrogenase nickel incorporation protein HypB